MAAESDTHTRPIVVHLPPASQSMTEQPSAMCREKYKVILDPVRRREREGEKERERWGGEGLSVSLLSLRCTGLIPASCAVVSDDLPSEGRMGMRLEVTDNVGSWEGRVLFTTCTLGVAKEEAQVKAIKLMVDRRYMILSERADDVTRRLGTQRGRILALVVSESPWAQT
ncbi:unnamed protein product [Pleuronectes platessa]|uniref:Uncharacterized protein n=1 Tax=Pleuronectes platessa TaxID=8262 RepID=A0A9N7VTB3_PLEPL|nr:unnamed protein product [Pleuronectes platessa]